jgi:hypothetical protein
MSVVKKRRYKGGGRRFIQLYHNVKRSLAYHDLSVYARCALFELLERYTGINNGMIGLGCRELAEELNCSRDTAARALRELDDSGLVQPLTAGVWRGKKATEWRLTFFRCDKTGEVPILNWDPSSQSVSQDAKVRVVGRNGPVSPSGRTQGPKNSMNENPLSPTGRTHIDIYQGDTNLVSGAGELEQPPSNEPSQQASNSFGPTEGNPLVAALGNWGVAVQRKHFEEVKARFDALPDPRLGVTA